jgi:hypothetical protein
MLVWSLQSKVHKSFPLYNSVNPIKKLGFYYMTFVWVWYWYCRCKIVALARDHPSRFPDPGHFDLQPFLAVDNEKLVENGSTWHSTCSSWPDLPNGRKISGWLHEFLGKLAVHPGVGATQLTISKFLRNAPSSSAVRHPHAFEQLEYCRP